MTEHFPFAQQIESLSDVRSVTRMYWLVDHSTTVIDYTVFDFKPPEYDAIYTHQWQNTNGIHAGVKLVPREHSHGIKYHDHIVCRKTFDIVHTEEQVAEYFLRYSGASHVWCVDPEYKLSDTINWSPDEFEPDYIHSFHLRGQLLHKYPQEEGGIKLYPRSWRQCGIKYHGCLDAARKYPVMFVTDPNDYTQRDHLTDDYVWLVDADHQVQQSTLDWVPDPFEDTMIHSFRMPRQLTHKYPSAMGGIRLVPRDWGSAELKIHHHCVVQDLEYDVFRTHREFNQDTLRYYADQSTTEWFWVIDHDYDFNGKLLYIPQPGEDEYIHVFKWGLEYRYDPSVLDLWDNRVGGIYLVHRDFDINLKKLHTGVAPIYYDVFYTNDMSNYQKYAQISRTEMFWMVDPGYVLKQDPQWIPPVSEQKYINIFKIPGQLEHKYPREITNVSDNRAGGVKLVPVKWQSAQMKFQGALNQAQRVKFQIFSDVHSGMAHTTHAWFWLVDPEVDVLPDFDFDFIPDEWDRGKDHVWQKLNPVTGKQYDYGGVTLYAVDKVPGRPRYIRQPASVQREYPQLRLLPGVDMLHQLTEFENSVDTAMYWVVDPYVEILPDFDFSYYPTQYDTDKVHVWEQTHGVLGGVRLIPKDFFSKTQVTQDEICYNRIPGIKIMAVSACRPPQWHMVHLDSYDAHQFREHIQHCPTDFMWTLDPDVTLDGDLPQFIPDYDNTGKPHAWQRAKPNGALHSYGGVRLWNTQTDFSDITYQSLEYNRIPGVQYVKTIASKFVPYDVIFISYQEPNADENYQHLTELTPAQRVHGVTGIYQAHREAAKMANTKMFWVVDGDAWVHDDFDFGYIPDVYDHTTTHVWSSLNPVTGDEYGYGGIKLFNRELVLNAGDWGLDFATGSSNKFRYVPVLSCTTRFNVDAFGTWRGAFRECVKLALQDSTESQLRLQRWLSPDPASDFHEQAIQGAKQALEFVDKYRDNHTQLSKINDYNYLHRRFTSGSA